MSKTTKTTKATKSTKIPKIPPQHVYAYVFNGGALKQNHCIIGVSKDHPETEVFNNLTIYCGGDIKGKYYKCTKSLEEVQTFIDDNFNEHY